MQLLSRQLQIIEKRKEKRAEGEGGEKGGEKEKERGKKRGKIIEVRIKQENSSKTVRKINEKDPFLLFSSFHLLSSFLPQTLLMSRLSCRFWS